MELHGGLEDDERLSSMGMVQQMFIIHRGVAYPLPFYESQCSGNRFEGLDQVTDMVMETPPSPECVGREFVRQYYTLLNEAPTHLHRFYNNSSSFIHGGLDAPNRDSTPVVGQRQIHQRIQQLNFRDCHAKISQVDSQATLGNGVVVQVTGELSNAGQPMRRFTQTFVLAAQSPKKFYVHNDIFRYQDMLTEEELESEMGRSETEEDHETEPGKNDILKQDGQTNVGYYNSVSQAVNGTSEPPPMEEPTPTVPVLEPPTPQPSQPLISSLDINQAPPMIQPIPEPTPTVNQNSGFPAVEETPVQPPEQIDTTGYHQQIDEPMKTYANLVKSGGNQMNNSSFYNNNSLQPQTQPKATTSPPPAKMDNRGEMKMRQSGPKPQRGSNEMGSRNNFQSPKPQNQPNNSEENNGIGIFHKFEGNYGGADADRRRPPPSFSDNHQLFMGNIPLTATETDLRQLFGKFGTIIDLRILTKNGGKGQVPNYGFITFEDTASVQAVLSAKPIFYPGDKEIMLNVEEKKARRPGGSGEGGGRGGPRGGQIRGGGMGGGGPSRGGRGGGLGGPGPNSAGGARFNRR